MEDEEDGDKRQHHSQRQPCSSATLFESGSGSCSGISGGSSGNSRDSMIEKYCDSDIEEQLKDDGDSSSSSSSRSNNSLELSCLPARRPSNNNGDGVGTSVNRINQSIASAVVLNNLSSSSYPSVTGSYLAGKMDALRPQKRKSNDLTDISLNKLCFKDLKLCGRPREVQKVQEILDRVSSSSGPEQRILRSVLFVKGYSGVGKSTFVHHAVQSYISSKRRNSLDHNKNDCRGDIEEPSSLASEAAAAPKYRDVQQTPSPFLVARGKFDQNVHQRPYSAMSSMCGEICSHILSLPSASQRAQIQSQIPADLGNELSLLTNVIPALSEIAVVPETSYDHHHHHHVINNEVRSSTMLAKTGDLNGLISSKAQASGRPHHHQQKIETTFGLDATMSSNTDEAKHRLRFAFQRFIRTICRFVSTLVIILDDMQWADGPSLDLFEALAFDYDNSGLFLVGIFRSNEVDEHGLLAKTIQSVELRHKSRVEAHCQVSSSLEVNTISIGNLSLESVNVVLQTLLRDDSPRTLELAEACYKKTHGNAFFLLHFIQLLCDKELLCFSFGTMQWYWNQDEVESKTIATDNVVGLLKSKMILLSDEEILLLQLAGCLGAAFEKKNLILLSQHFRSDTNIDPQISADFVDETLLSFEMEGYIIKTMSNHGVVTYVWAHDSIQEAAMLLVHEEGRRGFNYRVGEVLLDILDAPSRLSIIFVVVNLLNERDIVTLEPAKRVEIAGLNCDACKTAISLSAFESAARYAERGIELLGSKRWGENYSLTLELYTFAAKAACDLGNFECADRYCEEVLSSKTIPTEDKLAIYASWLDSIHTRGDTKRAIDLTLDLLKKFHCHFPKSPIGINCKTVTGIFKVKRSLSNLILKDFAPMDDTQKLKLIDILSRLSKYFYISNSPLLPLGILKAWNWTWKYGVSTISPIALSQTAVIFTGVLHDLRSGQKLATQALELLDLVECRSAKAETYFIAYGLVLLYTTPLRQMVKPTYDGYVCGMQCGNVDAAAWNILHHLIIRFIAGGCTLDTLAIDCRTYEQQMQDLQRGRQRQTMRLVRQLCLCLIGRGGNERCKLIGELFTEEENTYILQDSFYKYPARCWEGALLCIFGRYVEHADASLNHGIDQYEKAHPCSPDILLDSLAMGISFYAALQQTGKRKYRRGAERIRKNIHRWVEQGNPNVYVADLLLSAEADVFSGRNHSADRNYKAAFVMAARGGVFHEAMIISERMALFYLNVMDDKDEATYRIKDCIKYANEWGALAKIAQLHELYGHLLSEPSQIFISNQQRSNQ